MNQGRDRQSDREGNNGRSQRVSYGWSERGRAVHEWDGRDEGREEEGRD